MKTITGGNFFGFLASNKHLVVIAHTHSSDHTQFIDTISNIDLDLDATICHFNCSNEPELNVDLDVVEDFGIFYFRDGDKLSQINHPISLDNFTKSITLLTGSN